MIQHSETAEPLAVVKVINKLKYTRGVSVKDIINYIVTNYGLTETTVKRQLYNVLQKGLDFGLLSQHRGYYRINYNNSRHNLTQQICAKPTQQKPKKKHRIKTLKRLRRSKRKRTKTKKSKWS